MSGKRPGRPLGPGSVHAKARELFALSGPTGPRFETSRTRLRRGWDPTLAATAPSHFRHLPQIRCFECDGAGHMANACPTLGLESKKARAQRLVAEGARVPERAIVRRLWRGWSEEEAATRPLRRVLAKGARVQ